jgi:hypothetical protein
MYSGDSNTEDVGVEDESDTEDVGVEDESDGLSDICLEDFETLNHQALMAINFNSNPIVTINRFLEQSGENQNEGNIAKAEAYGNLIEYVVSDYCTTDSAKRFGFARSQVILAREWGQEILMKQNKMTFDDEKFMKAFLARRALKKLNWFYNKYPNYDELKSALQSQCSSVGAVLDTWRDECLKLLDLVFGVAGGKKKTKTIATEMIKKFQVTVEDHLDFVKLTKSAKSRTKLKIDKFRLIAANVGALNHDYLMTGDIDKICYLVTRPNSKCMCLVCLTFGD